MHEASLREMNDKAIALRSQGRLREAVGLFSEAIVRFPQAAVLYNNLAMTLDEMGAQKEALLAYDSALARAPQLVAALVGRASLLLRDGRIDEARASYEAALAEAPHSLPAHLGMYELLQIKGDLAGAVAHQREALEIQRLYSAQAPNERRSLLVLCAPGDWQTNVPVDFLFDRSTTSVHKLYLLDDARTNEQNLPRFDVVFNSIAESETAGVYLERARRVIDRLAAPFLNAPERVLGVGRLRLPETLRGVDCAVPPVTAVERAQLERGELPFEYPAIVRPAGSHAGHDLERIASAEELAAYAARTQAERYYVSPFVDYSGGDGLFRKYRIVFVDGVAYPVHLAISPNWMIHYYNAPMAEHAWMREEEAAFLADLGSVFQGPSFEALGALAKAVGLEYFGIDCSLGRDGRLLVFEADPAMLVHTTDPVDLYPYKHEYIPRIFRAIERMIDARKTADT